MHRRCPQGTQGYLAEGKIMTLLDDLIEARKIIARNGGWGRGLPSFHGKDGSYCMAGAVAFVTCTDPAELDNPQRYRAGYRALQAEIPQRRVTVAQFNDNPDNSRADCLAVFTRAIETARAA